MTRAPINLPDVTLVIIGNVEMELTRRAIKATLEQIRPAAVHIWSDKWDQNTFIDAPVRLFPVGIQSITDVEELLWREVPLHLTTSHMLMIQWDGWVIDGREWQEEFLQYDYIGAPWAWRAGNRVGNGGFSLRSARLMREVASFDIIGPEDTALCRYYRSGLERLGFTWAPEALANQFSRERVWTNRKTFGFHGSFNFPSVLSGMDLVDYVAAAGDYARTRIEWDQMMRVVNA